MSTFLSTINCFGWEDFFEEQKTHSYWESLNQKVEHAYRTSRCFPESKAIFRAFEGTPAAEVKCIIMGQDPYHGPGQAMGLSFSVPPSVSKLPPSLRNIFNEYEQDLGLQTPRNGDLTEWAKNGVLLLNTILSVEESKPGSHHNLGWQELTKNAVRFVLEQNPGVGFLCFGAPAQKLTESILQEYPNAAPTVVHTAHPSPLSAYRGFFGSKPFTTFNKKQAEKGLEMVNWELPSSTQQTLF